jgi:hypothetical protein
VSHALDEPLEVVVVFSAVCHLARCASGSVSSAALAAKRVSLTTMRSQAPILFRPPLMAKPALSSTDGHQRRSRQLDSLRTFPLGCFGRTRTNARDRRWRHLGVRGRQAGSCANGSAQWSW